MKHPYFLINVCLFPLNKISLWVCVCSSVCLPFLGILNDIFFIIFICFIWKKQVALPQHYENCRWPSPFLAAFLIPNSLEGVSTVPCSGHRFQVMLLTILESQSL